MLYLRANQTIDAEGDLLVAVQEAFQLWGMSSLTNAVCEPTGMYLDCRLREQARLPQVLCFAATKSPMRASLLAKASTLRHCQWL